MRLQIRQLLPLRFLLEKAKFYRQMKREFYDSDHTVRTELTGLFARCAVTARPPSTALVCEFLKLDGLILLLKKIVC